MAKFPKAVNRDSQHIFVVVAFGIQESCMYVCPVILANSWEFTDTTKIGKSFELFFFRWLMTTHTLLCKSTLSGMAMEPLCRQVLFPLIKSFKSLLILNSLN